MTSWLNSLLVVVLAFNLFALGTSRMRALIRTVGLQGALLAVMPLIVHPHIGVEVVLISLATIALKGIIIPVMLMRALRKAEIKREIEPLIGLFPSMLLGAAATGFAMTFARQLPLVGDLAESLLVPASLATVLVGFILLTTRYKAITQVIGYLVLENGIFIFGMLLIAAMPAIVEVAMLLDLFVLIFVMGIIVNHINRAFSSLDTRRLTELKE